MAKSRRTSVNHHIVQAGMGDDVLSSNYQPTLDLIASRTAEILQRQKDEETRRKWTLVITIAGSLFAAVRLGIIAIPHIRRAKTIGDVTRHF